MPDSSGSISRPTTTESMNHPTPESPPIPVSIPAAQRLFFAELLPAGHEAESAGEVESRVLLDLETGSPLPADRLAYGWVRLPSREILYYAAPRERVPAHDAFAPAGTVLPAPDNILLPDGVSPEDFARATRDFYADLRPRPELAELRSRAKADALLSRLALPLKLGALAGVLVMAAVGVLFVMVATSRHRYDAIAEPAKAAEAKADMLASLERLEGPGRSIFDALAIVNPYRPEGVSFTRVTLVANRELSLEGRATGTSGVSSITKMESALKDSGVFSSSEAPKVETSGGRPSFRMRFLMTKWPEVADSPKATAAIVAAPAEAAEEHEAPAAHAAPAASEEAR